MLACTSVIEKASNDLIKFKYEEWADLHLLLSFENELWQFEEPAEDLYFFPTPP